MNRTEIKSAILKCSKSTNPKNTAALAIFYYKSFVSPFVKKGSYISFDSIEKAFNIRFGEKTIIEINKLLFTSQFLSNESFAEYIAEILMSNTKKNA